MDINSSTYTSEDLSSGVSGSMSSFNRMHREKDWKGRATKRDSGDHVHLETKVTKSLQSLGIVKTVPRWDPLEDMGARSQPGYVARHNRWQSSDKNASYRRSGITWDHLLGVARKTGDFKSSLHHLASRKFKLGAHNWESTHVPLGGSQVGIINGSSSDSTQIFSSDDEPLDQDVRDRLEEVTAIEDALLLRTDKARNGFMHSWADKKPNKGETYRNERSSKAPFDPLNPANNPLLQDPDTSGPSGLSGSDKAILKALQRASIETTMLESGKAEAKPGIAEIISSQDKSENMIVTDRNSTTTAETRKGVGGKLGNAAERSILEVSVSDSFRSPKVIGEQGIDGISAGTDLNLVSGSSKEEHLSSKPPRSSGDTRKWGFYPGLDSALTFTEFLDQFLMDSRCSLSVFMAWTTPPWTYSIRYQRGLESLFYFHSQACVVVFSESIELNFFMGFVEEGFKVAVVVPNLEELLKGTPADVFASFWLAWRKTDLFYIHYTELLRLAALYKYGGIYLDTDVILLKPLDFLHNTIGAERIENHTQRLNGAVMAFDKFSPFLLECLAEFTATYNDRLLDFNGAGLVTRVADRTAEEENENRAQHTGELYIESPHAFFPLSCENITRYFTAPVNREQQLETDRLIKLIFNQSLTLHFWNQRTKRLVPEVGSLVERVINHHCIKCHEYL